ncbi:hypothetical protein [Sphingobacterium hotanense]|uniref:Uncharacterized protein n=1 Tax=Sphingobacterium hotanense TaxID=649196 RepID=A0ABT7NQ57_9SPHI|nr:hypothetical protein [Sphingobacterium hotanense]MDM1049377.1 hypothetical protein [Sphingobacterium hotanense]
MKKSLKTSLDAQADVKALLDATALPAMITGQIRHNMRMLNSTKEDITIGTLYWDGDQSQSGIINVNIHVPNLKGQYGEGGSTQDRTQPNIPRFLELAAIAVPVLDFHNGLDFSLRLRNPGKLENFGNDWIYNIQVDYNYLRIDI